MDREAYEERRAILEFEGTRPLAASRDASDYAYRARLSMAATAMANGDPQPARVWVMETAVRWGKEVADEFVREIDRNIDRVMEGRR